MPELDKRQQQALDALLSAKKLRELCPDTIRRVFLECLPKYKSLKDVDKAARTELHRITGAFVTPENLALAERLLDGWQSGDDETLAHALALHASTKERLPLADTDALYDRICDCIGRPETVLDLACGFNPIYLASRGYDVMGLDLHGGAVRLINRWAQQKSLPARAQTADLLSENALPEEAFDLALMMKLLPILDTQQSGAARRLIDSVNARHIAVSFPTRTLGGRGVGMEAHYSQWFEALIPAQRIRERFTHGSELIYILEGNR